MESCARRSSARAFSFQLTIFALWNFVEAGFGGQVLIASHAPSGDVNVAAACCFAVLNKQAGRRRGASHAA
jgi:hypothetical protein